MRLAGLDLPIPKPICILVSGPEEYENGCSDWIWSPSFELYGERSGSVPFTALSRSTRHQAVDGRLSSGPDWLGSQPVRVDVEGLLVAFLRLLQCPSPNGAQQ